MISLQFLNFFSQSKDEVSLGLNNNELLRHEFVKNLLRDNHLMIRIASGDILTVSALSFDKIHNRLIVSDQAERGILYLEEGEKVEFFTMLNDQHEYFSFVSKVAKIKTKGVKLSYHMTVPKKLKKSRRRLLPRVEVNNHSIIRLGETSFSGSIQDLSLDGIGFSLRGYYPEALEIGDNLNDCRIDIFQPRINDNVSFECSINIRRLQYEAKPERATLIGGIFTHFSSGKESQVSDFLLEEYRKTKLKSAMLNGY